MILGFPKIYSLLNLELTVSLRGREPYSLYYLVCCLTGPYHCRTLWGLSYSVKDGLWSCAEAGNTVYLLTFPKILFNLTKSSHSRCKYLNPNLFLTLRKLFFSN